MPAPFLLGLLWLPLLAQTPNVPTPEARAQLEAQTVKLRAVVQHAPRLKLERSDLKPAPIRSDLEIGMVSWIAADRNGLVYKFSPEGKKLMQSNARILEYTADGTKVREWGSPGSGPGQFRLPHSIQVDENDVVYVADRENGRIQRLVLARFRSCTGGLTSA